MREKLVEKEMSGCTFKPDLYRPMNIYAFTDPKVSKQNSHFFAGQNGYDLGGGIGDG